LDTGQTRPRKIFHPRRVRRLWIDRAHLGARERRVPPIVEDEPAIATANQPFLRELLDGVVAAVSVHDENAAEPGLREAVENVADDGQVRLDLQRDGAGKREEVGRDAV